MKTSMLFAAKKVVLPLLGLAIFPSLLQAFDTFADEGDGFVVTWKRGEINMEVGFDNTIPLSDGRRFLEVFNDAADEWNAQIANVEFDILGVADDHISITDGVNGAAFSDSIAGSSLGPNTLAVTVSTRDLNSPNHWAYSDIIFNESVEWDSYRGPLRDAVDFRRVVLRQLGHLLGLASPDLATPPQSVVAVMNSQIGDVDQLQDDDISGGQFLYGVPGLPPANDDFANSTEFVLGGAGFTTVSGSSVQASAEANEPRLNLGVNEGEKSVWWRWTAPSTGVIVATTQGSNFDTILGVFTGSAVGALNPIRVNDDAIPAIDRTSAIVFPVLQGITYHFVVDGWAGYEGSVKLNVGYADPPGPDLTIAQPRLIGDLGSPVILAVEAEAVFEGELSYQWFKDTEILEGETASTLSIDAFSNLDAGVYKVAAKEANGGSSIGLFWVMPDYGATEVLQIASRGNYSAPPSEIASMDDIVQVATGDDFGMGLRRNGSVVVWSMVDTPGTPSVLAVPEGLSDVVRVAAGYTHCLALRADGTVVAWGGNVFGQADVPVDLYGVVEISGGLRHSVARKADGTATGWGELEQGASAQPPEGFGPIMAISAKRYNNVSLKTDGSVYSWGGDLNSVPTLQSGLVQVEAHSDGGIALSRTGQVVTWGNSTTQLKNIPDGVIRVFGGQFDVALLRSNRELSFYGQFTNWPQGSLPIFDSVLDASIGWSRAAILRDVTQDAVPPQGGTVVGPNQVAVGDFLELRARPYGSPEMTHTWFRGSIPIADDDRIHGATTPTLRIEPVSLADAGAYRLLSRNTSGTAFSSTHEVAVEAAPIITARPLSQLARQGQVVEFSINASSDQAITYEWQKNGQILKNRSGDRLVLDPVTLADRGRYTVTARDSRGEAYSHFFLHVAVSGAEAVHWADTVASEIDTLAKPYGGFAKIIESSNPQKGMGLGADGRVFRWGDWGPEVASWDDLKGLVDVIAFPAHDLVIGLRQDGSLVGGGVGFNTRPFPDGLTEVVDLAGDGSRFAVLRADGTIAAWQTLSGDPFVPSPNRNIVDLGGPNSYLYRDGTTAGSGPGNFPRVLSGVVDLQANTALLQTGELVVGDVERQNYLPPLLDSVIRAQPGLALRSNGELVVWEPAGRVTGPAAEFVPAAAEGAFEVATDLGNFGSVNGYWVLVPGSGPAVISEEWPADLSEGGDAQLRVEVVAGNPVSFQWYRDGISLQNSDRISGAQSARITIRDLGAQDLGGYHVVVVGAEGTVESLRTQLEFAARPQILQQPQSAALIVGDDFVLSVETVEAETFQWRKDGTDIVGATSSALELSDVQLADAGSYSVEVTNGVGSVVSETVEISVQRPPPVFGGTHQVTEDARVPGGNVTVSNRFTSDRSLTLLHWSVLLPESWSFVSWEGPPAALQPSPGSESLLEWRWTAPASTPLEFSYVLASPEEVGFNYQLSASFEVEGEGLDDTGLVLRDPLILRPGFHSGDIDRDMQFGLSELLRVIEIYNTRAGSTRTGRYKLNASSEDGFDPDTREASEGELPVQFHSGDVDRNGRLSLSELLRVIELYNTRSGTTRTGRYRIDQSTEDGFAPEP